MAMQTTYRDKKKNSARNYQDASMNKMITHNPKALNANAMCTVQYLSTTEISESLSLVASQLQVVMSKVPVICRDRRVCVILGNWEYEIFRTV